MGDRGLRTVQIRVFSLDARPPAIAYLVAPRRNIKIKNRSEKYAIAIVIKTPRGWRKVPI